MCEVIGFQSVSRRRQAFKKEGLYPILLWVCSMLAHTLGGMATLRMLKVMVADRHVRTILDRLRRFPVNR